MIGRQITKLSLEFLTPIRRQTLETPIGILKPIACIRRQALKGLIAVTYRATLVVTEIFPLSKTILRLSLLLLDSSQANALHQSQFAPAARRPICSQRSACSARRFLCPSVKLFQATPSALAIPMNASVFAINTTNLSFVLIVLPLRRCTHVILDLLLPFPLRNG